MKYQPGKPFVCESIGQSKRPKPLEYSIPTESENQKYLNLLGKEVHGKFEREVIERRAQREQYEKNKLQHNW